MDGWMDAVELRLQPNCHAAAPVPQLTNHAIYLPRFYYPPMFARFHVVYSAWQSTGQTLHWAAWNGGSGSTELLVHDVRLCVLFMETPLPDHSLKHLVVSPPTRGQNSSPLI